MRTLCLIVLTAVSLSLSGGPASADKRVALVIGNSAYQNVSRLDNPKNDAALIAKTMRDLGFILVGNGPQFDLDKAALDRAVQDFGRSIQGADVALFYYAGHGVQVNGSNFLVPVNANPTREADVDFQMVDVNVILRQMQGSGTRLNVVILDACRNNPFGVGGLRAAQGGLAQMRAPEGTLISYATQPGNVAQDGDVNIHKGARQHRSPSRARHLPDLQPGRTCREAGNRRHTAAVGLVLADRRRFLFRSAAGFGCIASAGRTCPGRSQIALSPRLQRRAQVAREDCLGGRGVTQDRSEARKWFEKAAATGFERAKIALQKLNSP